MTPVRCKATLQWRCRAAQRGAAAVTLTAAVLLLTAAPALAHTRAEIATNFDSRLTGIPDLPATSWQVLAGGDLLEVDHRGAEELIILGYEGEPYLRLGPHGVEENRNSPAAYLNIERYADVTVPPRADPDAAPEWVRVSGEPRHAWHDHRIHWMAPDPPPSVADATERMLVHEWSVPVLVDGRDDAVAGELWWVPASFPWGWLVLGAALTAPALAGLRHRHRDPVALVRPAAVVLIAVAAMNVFLVVDEVTWPAPLMDQLFGAFHQVLFVGAGLGGAGLALRSSTIRFLALGAGSGAVLFHQALLPLRMLWAPELPTVWPAGVLRTLVALSLMQAVWIAVVIVTGLAARQEPAPRPAPEEQRATTVA